MKTAMHTLRVILLLALVFAASADCLSEAQTYYEKGDYHAALRLYEQCVFSSPNPALVYFNMANCWYQLDSLANAAVCYEMSIAEAPEFFRAWLNLGILKYNLNDYPGVVAALERARSFQPDNTQLLLILASAYRRLESLSNTIPLLEYAVSIDPGLEKGYFMLYEANYRLGNLDGAAHWLRMCPDKASGRIREKYILLAELSEEQGKLNEALSWWRKVMDAFPEERWASYKYVSLLARQQTVLLALEEADEALEKYPDFGEMALIAGSIATDAGLLDRASRYFMRAWELGFADGLVGLQNLIVLYSEKQDNASAAQLATLIGTKRGKK
jgi:tetratricopeptide (TPR) repeat protein